MKIFTLIAALVGVVEAQATSVPIEPIATLNVRNVKADQPSLIVNDLKHGQSKGAVALWIGPGVVAHFANLQVSQ